MRIPTNVLPKALPGWHMIGEDTRWWKARLFLSRFGSEELVDGRKGNKVNLAGNCVCAGTPENPPDNCGRKGVVFMSMNFAGLLTCSIPNMTPNLPMDTCSTKKKRHYRGKSPVGAGHQPVFSCGIKGACRLEDSSVNCLTHDDKATTQSFIQHFGV